MLFCKLWKICTSGRRPQRIDDDENDDDEDVDDDDDDDPPTSLSVARVGPFYSSKTDG